VILSVGSIDKENGRQRRQGLIDNLLGRSIDRTRQADPVDATLKGDTYTIDATLIDNVDTGKVTTLTVDAVKKYPNVKCIVGLFGYTTPALLDGLKQSGKLGQIKVIGFDNADQTLAGIEEGNVYGTLVQDQHSMGFTSVLLLRQFIDHDSASANNLPISFLYCDSLTNAEDVKLYRERLQAMQAAKAQ
jgi:ribose transport system substrate-binding protein